MSGGKLYGDGERDVFSLFLDSREAIETAVFVPIIGEKVDAHKFIPDVFSKSSASFSQNEIPNPSGDYILVDDTKMALQEFSLSHRLNFNIPFIAITGSVGKTTTKEIVACAVENQIATLKTYGNANSQVGLPLTLLRVNENHKCAIIEMGMSLVGEMEKISYCARPNMAVFTNIGVSHIENLGSKEKILEEKLHVTDYFSNNDIMFINGDDPLLKALKGKKNFRVVDFGLSEDCDYRAFDITENDFGTEFSVIIKDKTHRVKLSCLGEHNIRNALAALAVSDSLNLDIEKSIEDIYNYTPPEMRQQIIKTEKFTIIDDSYNSSPDSAKSALGILSKLNGRKIAVLADMLELGSYSEKGHKEVGEFAKEMGVDYLISYGEESISTHNAFNDMLNSIHFTDFSQAEDFVSKFVKDGDCILVKGSRGMKCERFVTILKGE